MGLNVEKHSGIDIDIDAAFKMLTNVANAANARGLRKLRTVAVLQMNVGIRSAFAGGRNPMGGAWPKRKGGQSHSPLVRTGTLAQNVHGETVIRGSRLFIYGAVDDARSGKGSLHELAGVLFFGRRKGPAPMPARPFAGIGKHGISLIAETLNRQIGRVK